MAEFVVGVASGGRPAAWPAELWVTPPLALERPPDRIVVSGGVAEFLDPRQDADFGDLGRELADGLRIELAGERLADRLLPPAATIRATVIGASQYTVQLSGNTVSIEPPSVVPLRNLRVVSPSVSFPLDGADPRAWPGTIATTCGGTNCSVPPRRTRWPSDGVARRSTPRSTPSPMAWPGRSPVVDGATALSSSCSTGTSVGAWGTSSGRRSRLARPCGVPRWTDGRRLRLHRHRPSPRAGWLAPGRRESLIYPGPSQNRRGLTGARWLPRLVLIPE